MASKQWIGRTAVVLAVVASLVSIPISANAANGTLIYSIGDSIFTDATYGNWGTEFPAAIAPNGQSSIGINASASRSISASGSGPGVGSGTYVVQTNASTIAAADIVITNLGINDSEVGVAWYNVARSYAQAIKTANPSVKLVWITPVAEPGVASATYVDRGVDHAASVRTLRNEGLVDLVVDWDTYALGNTNVFNSDGLHYTNAGSAYASFAASAIASLADTPTTTTTKPTTTTTAKPTTTTTTKPKPTTTTVKPDVSQLLPVEAELYRLYNAVFGRPSDDGGLEYWAVMRGRGLTIFDVADNFTASPEWTNRYGNTLTNAQVVDALYANVLNRTGDQEGRAYWNTMLQRGMKRSELIVYFTNSPENVQRTGTAS